VDYKARIFTSISIILVAVFLTYRGAETIPQFASTLVYYFLIASAVYMLKSASSEKNTLQITVLKDEETEETLYEVSGKLLNEKETILLISRKMNVGEEEAIKFLKKVSDLQATRGKS